MLAFMIDDPKGLLDAAMPEFHFRERHGMVVDASPERVFAALEQLDLSRSATIRWLFRLRGLEWRDLRLQRLIEDMHMTRSRSADERLFTGEERIGSARLGLAWNFTVRDGNAGERIVSTETRVHCSTLWLRAVFAGYWMVIRPFSGWIRLIMLRLLREDLSRPAAITT
jgi:hypothetical protein